MAPPITRYHYVAVVPGIIAILCVVAAWYIMTRRTQQLASPPPPPPPLQLQHSIHPPLPPPPLYHTPATTTTTTPPSFSMPAPPTSIFARAVAGAMFKPLPSDNLITPTPGARRHVGTAACAQGLATHRRVWKLNFDASCRDNSVWPTTSAWRMNLPTTMRNISSVTLRSVGLMPAEYTVDVHNNTFALSFGGTVYTVTVPSGMYGTGGALASAVGAALVATDAALAGFSAAYTPLTDTITISESTPAAFTLLFYAAASTMWSTLGFARADTASVLVGGSHDAVAPGRVDLTGVLAIDVFVDELTSSLDGPVGRVLLDRNVTGDPVFRESHHEDFHQFWPLGRLKFLTFRFMVQVGRQDEDGTVVCAYRPYLFHGRNVSVGLDVGETSYINPMEADVQLGPGT